MLMDSYEQIPVLAAGVHRVIAAAARTCIFLSCRWLIDREIIYLLFLWTAISPLHRQIMILHYKLHQSAQYTHPTLPSAPVPPAPTQHPCPPLILHCVIPPFLPLFTVWSIAHHRIGLVACNDGSAVALGNRSNSIVHAFAQHSLTLR